MRLLAALLVGLLSVTQASADFLINPYRYATSSAQTAMQTITTLGLTSNLQLVLDAGDSASWENTVALLHFDGADASTTFTDEHGHTVTVRGNAQLDTAQKKFGTASGLFDGNDDYVTMDGSDFTFGTGDFTIEGFLRLNATGLTQVFYDSRPTSTNGLYPTIFVGSGDVLVYFTNSTNRIVGTTTLTTGVWYHWAVSRSGTSTKLFLDGTQEGSTYTDSNNYLNGASRPALSANGLTLTTGELNGWLDEVRVTKGLARYTANFTAPSAAFLAGKWLDTSGNGYDFFRGAALTSGTDDPTFNGTPGALTSSEYFSFDGGDFFTYDTTNETWMQNLHKNNAAFTFAGWIYLGGTGVTQHIVATMDNSGTDTGIRFYVATNESLNYQVVNAGTQVIAQGTTGSISVMTTGQWYFIAVAVDEPTVSNGTLWQQDGDNANDGSTYTLPAAGNATGTMRIGAGTAGAFAFPSGTRLGIMMAWSTALTQPQLMNVYAATKGRYQ